MPDDTDSLTTVRDLVRWGASRFAEAELHFGHGTDNALDESLQLVLHGLHLDYDLPLQFLDSHVTADERQDVIALLRRRIVERVPAPYLTGQARFAGSWYRVDEHVLVPRSPIAELIERRFAPWVEPDAVNRILDLCTGSGCIAIACAHAFPDAIVDAVEISGPAVALARTNVAEHDVGDRVRVIEGDLYGPLDTEIYDLIVSNPPYVSAREMAGIPPEYRHEPVLGLEAGSDGLDVVRHILAGARRRMEAGGILVVEVGGSAGRLAEAFPEVPFTWLDFERGGDGVFLLSAEQLDALATSSEEGLQE